MPLCQSDEYIHYWGNLIEEIRFTQQDVSREWDRFWQFWRTAQTLLRAKNHPNIYGVGLCK